LSQLDNFGIPDATVTVARAVPSGRIPTPPPVAWLSIWHVLRRDSKPCAIPKILRRMRY